MKRFEGIPKSALVELSIQKNFINAFLVNLQKH